MFFFFFLGNIGKGKVFYDILQRKNSFLGYKNKKFKKSKNWHFYKGVNSWFFPKMTIIPTCFFPKMTIIPTCFRHHIQITWLLLVFN